MDDDAQMDALDKCPHCDVLVYSPDGICPACGKTLDVEGHKLDFSQVDESWHDRKVFDSQTGHYLGRAVGEPFSDGVEGLIALRQDESGQTIKSHALCAFVVLDDPARSLLADQGGAARGCAACDGDPEAHGLHVCGEDGAA